MLKLLLDEHISPEVGRGLARRISSITVHHMTNWENGDLVGQDDAARLELATRQSLTLVTYDRRTIPPLLKTWAESGRDHGGVIFIDEKTIAPSQIGTLVRALSSLYQETYKWDWTDRVCFLRR